MGWVVPSVGGKDGSLFNKMAKMELALIYCIHDAEEIQGFVQAVSLHQALI